MAAASGRSRPGVAITTSPSGSPAATPAPRATPPSARTLMARLRRVPPQDDIDPATYAGYRDHVEEASVEIVRAKPAQPQRQT